MTEKFLTGSFYKEIEEALQEIGGPHNHTVSDISDFSSSVTAVMDSTITAITNRLDILETWKGFIGAKRADVYTGTTDANGDLTINFPSGRYTNTPVFLVTYEFNNNNYGTFYNIKAMSKDTIVMRVMRNKNTTIGALGGDVDPDQSLASTAVKITAFEF